MTDIKQAYSQTPEELLAIARKLHLYADKIESGEVTAVAYIALEKLDLYRVDYVKTQGTTMLELVGAADMLASALRKHLEE